MVSDVARVNVRQTKKKTFASSTYILIKFKKKNIKIQNISVKIKNSFKFKFDRKKKKIENTIKKIMKK